MKKSYTFMGRCCASVSSILNLLSIVNSETLGVLGKLMFTDNRVYAAKVSSQSALQSFCTRSNIPMVIQDRKMN
ncbi:hypothetical protein [Emticicia agri]|uniref:Uncharacterized protein n=1 Tax=Emticicia agri TaxID=2492393 RepID=A0A4Q5LT21_9BACT|nr:hypothetical protein [Emticicia agri]RYU92655.1 hypothetical protein EWM59_26110 [Emticicia agri]